MANSAFYESDPVRQIATNLFYGWGYNFYRVENQWRADDQLVRSKAAWLLGIAMESVVVAETNYRREFLPAPSRKAPFPDPAAIAGAQRLERLAREIGALEAAIQQQPVPENDRMTQRFREEAPTLQALVHHDEQLVGQCELLRSMLNQQSGALILQNIGDLDHGLEAIRGTLHSRQAVLLDHAR